MYLICMLTCSNPTLGNLLKQPTHEAHGGAIGDVGQPGLRVRDDWWVIWFPVVFHKSPFIVAKSPFIGSKSARYWDVPHYPSWFGERVRLKAYRIVRKTVGKYISDDLSTLWFKETSALNINFLHRRLHVISQKSMRSKHSGGYVGLFIAAFCCLHLATVGLWNSPPRRCFTAIDSEIVKLQQRRDQLKCCLKSMKFPPPKTFTVDGKIYPLPLKTLKTVGPPPGEPSREELEYLAGFFDGDGRVTMNDRSVVLSVSQSIDSARVLLRFREAFGGGVRLSENRHGCCRAVLAWVICGDASRRASWMATVACLKQAELKIASSRVSGLQLGTVRAKLKTLKKPTPIPMQFCCSWSYFAGFFDAGGCIVVTRLFALRLEVTQNNRYILEYLLKFLHQSHLDRWKFRKLDTSRWVLACEHRGTCLRTLLHLVDHGLSLKKLQADLVIETKPSWDTNLALREAVSNLKGQQSRFERLDGEGVLRAQAIQRLQVQRRRKPCPKEDKLLAEEIKKLQQKHARGKLLCEIRKLKADICQGLSEGGYFVGSRKELLQPADLKS